MKLKRLQSFQVPLFLQHATCDITPALSGRPLFPLTFTFVKQFVDISSKLANSSSCPLARWRMAISRYGLDFSRHRLLTRFGPTLRGQSRYKLQIGCKLSFVVHFAFFDRQICETHRLCADSAMRLEFAKSFRDCLARLGEVHAHTMVGPHGRVPVVDRKVHRPRPPWPPPTEIRRSLWQAALFLPDILCHVQYTTPLFIAWHCTDQVRPGTPDCSPDEYRMNSRHSVVRWERVTEQRGSMPSSTVPDSP